MSWRDRPYSGDEFEPQLRLQFRRPTGAVTWLILANIAVFLIDLISQRWQPEAFDRVFGLSFVGIRRLYLWQLVTYTFLHVEPWHLLVNMLGLYFLGMEFQRTFGRDRFLQFYFACGIIGGLAYVALSAARPGMQGQLLMGASGAVYGLIVAAMIFFPQMQVVLFVFPVPIRVFGALIGAILLLKILSPGPMSNPGGELCHIAGAFAGVITLYLWGVMPKLRIGSGRLARAPQEGAWARKQKQAAEEQAEVDRILAKIHNEGLNSLTRREKRILAEATRHQREREREFGRIDRF